ncbi:hypothetical protein R3P38DRAFT_2952878, partial [Favolaschia claudopus]
IHSSLLTSTASLFSTLFKIPLRNCLRKVVRAQKLKAAPRCSLVLALHELLGHGVAQQVHTPSESTTVIADPEIFHAATQFGPPTISALRLSVCVSAATVATSVCLFFVASQETTLKQDLTPLCYFYHFPLAFFGLWGIQTPRLMAVAAMFLGDRIQLTRTRKSLGGRRLNDRQS